MEDIGNGKSDAVDEPVDAPESGEYTASTGLAWRRRLVVILMLLVGVSVAGRVHFTKKQRDYEATQRSLAGNQTTALVPGQIPSDQQPEQAAEPPPSGMAKLLPFLTEGGVAMLLGIALGVATRAFLKLILIGVAVIFIGIQVLSYNEILTVNWEAAEEGFSAVQRYVMNFADQNNLGQIVTHKIPAAGSLMIGYFLGLKR